MSSTISLFFPLTCFQPLFQNHSPGFQHCRLISESYNASCPLKIHKFLWCHDVRHKVFLLKKDKHTVKSIALGNCKTIAAIYVNTSKKLSENLPSLERKL
jgi:hypothetical protein